MTNSKNHEDRDLNILEHIEENPEVTQATIAERMGVAVGTVNWHLKRLIEKGYVKVRRAERRKLRYIITPQGLAHRANLLVDYINTSFNLYRLIRQRSIKALEELKKLGYKSVFIDGSGDVAEICRLTCLEQGFEVVSEKNYPALHIKELKIFIHLEDEKHVE